MGVWFAVLAELVKLGRRYPVAALLILTGIVSAVVGFIVGRLVT
jgi:hypothetical protein